MYWGIKIYICKMEVFYDFYYLFIKIKFDEYRVQIVVDSFLLKNRDIIWVKSYFLDICIFRISVIVVIYMYYNRFELYNDIL